jgi:DMSO/TMAO reductase YedYZ molybdopterin-dependent catalytic subunit
MADSPVLLRFEGAVERPIGLTFADLSAIAEESQVADVSRFQPTRRGDALTLASLLNLAGPDSRATHLTLHADRDDFHVSILLETIRDQGLVTYKLGGEPLEVEQGGPIRLLIRDPSACHSGELDECANVKYLSRIELSIGRGRDTRPVDDVEHQALHDRSSSTSQ